MCVLWYVITAHSHIRGATTGAGCLYGSCWCDYQRRWANIAKSSKHTSSIWLLHNYYRYNVKPKYPLISYVDVCLMAVLYTDAGDECCIITIEWWYWVEMAWLQPCRGRRDYVDWCTVRTWLRDGQMTDLFLKLQRLFWQIPWVEYVVWYTGKA